MQEGGAGAQYPAGGTGSKGGEQRVRRGENVFGDHTLKNAAGRPKKEEVSRPKRVVTLIIETTCTGDAKQKQRC